MTDAPHNPYAPPTAPLERPMELGAGGSLADAVAGRYDFTIGEVMSEAWHLLKGFKRAFWGPALIIFVFAIVASAVAGGVIALEFGRLPFLVDQVLNALFGALLEPLNVGITVIAIRRASGLPNSFQAAFAGLSRIPVLVGGGALVLLLTYLGLALLVIPGLYLGVAYAMTLPLLMFHKMPVWTAMETSRRAITHKWFRIFGLGLVVGLIVMLSALALLIPLIWTIPWGVLVMGVLYRRMFGPVPAPVAQ